MLEGKSVLLFLMILHIAASNMSLYDHVVKMEQVILSVEYNNRHLNVWKETSHGYNRFYVTPLCTLETSTINCSRDEYSNEHRHILTFRVKIWDLQAAEAIKLGLAQKNIDAKVTDILPLPMLMVRLGINQDVSHRISVDKQWRSNQDQPNTITFELYTRHEHFCDKMVNDAKADPETFLSRTKLFLEFTMVVGQQASRNLNITGETFIKSKFIGNLQNEHNNDSGIVYLQSSDLNKLARDIYRTASITIADTSTYVPSEQENQIISELLDVFKSQSIHSNDLTKAEWNSVFWDDIFARPDIQTDYFNQVLKYDEGENNFRYNKTSDDEFRKKIHQKHHHERERKNSGDNGFSFMGFGFNFNDDEKMKSTNDAESQKDVKRISKNTLSFDDLQKHLKKDNINVRWSGTKFSPKDLLLYRVNTKTLKTSGEIFYKRIVTTKFESSQKIEIRTEPQQRQTVFESPVYFEELKNQIKILKEELVNITTNFQKRSEIIESKISTQNQLVTDKTNKLANDLVNTNQHITNIVNDVNGKRDALQHQHNVLRNDHNALRNEYNVLNSWTRNDFWNNVQRILRHADNIWLRTYPNGAYDDNVKATFKSRWGVIL